MNKSGVFFTVIESPRHSGRGDNSHGVYRSRKAAQTAMEGCVREELTDYGMEEDEIEDYIADDSIDTPDTCWSVGRLYTNVGEVHPT